MTERTITVTYANGTHNPAYEISLGTMVLHDVETFEAWRRETTAEIVYVHDSAFNNDSI